MIKQVIQQLLDRQELYQEQMEAVMRLIMSGEATDAQIAAFLVALRMKGETVEEMTAGATVMRELSAKVQITDTTHLVDTCGTGGDGLNTFNISTASAFVAAAAGAKVAKHGGRTNAGKSGSADLLEAANVNLSLTPEQVGECIDELGFGFMYAPMHHSAMKYVAGVRKELGIRTIFNVLGPLTNPAGAPNQVLGVFSKGLVYPFAKVLKTLGARHVMVVHAQDGLDEISTASLTDVAELKDGKITQWQINPADYDMDHADLKDLSVECAQDSLNMIHAVFANNDSGAKDIICLNAGASIYVAGICNSYAEAVQLAREVIADGRAQAKFRAYIDKTHQF